MRRLASSIVFALVCVALVVPPALAKVRKVRSVLLSADSTAVRIPEPPTPSTPSTPPEPPVRKKIVIGGSGVRIDDEGISVEDSDSEGVTFDFDFNDDREDYGEDIVKVGESVFVASDEVVAGDIVVFGGNAIIEGTVTGSVVVLGGEIRARRGAEIRGDIVAIGGSIEEDEEVVIRGEKILIGGVAGTIGDYLNMSTRGVRTVLSGVTIFVALVLFFVTILFLRTRVERASDHIAAGLLRCFGIGVLTSIGGLFALLMVMIPLIIFVIGIPLAAILAISCVGVYVIACATLVYSAGRAFADRAGVGAGVFGRLLLGLAILCIPELIAFVLDAIGRGTMPLWVTMKVLSGLVWLFAYIVGLGAIVVSRFGSRPVGTVPPPARVVGEPAGAPVG